MGNDGEKKRRDSRAAVQETSFDGSQGLAPDGGSLEIFVGLDVSVSSKASSP